jgi:hypothetical protein
MPISYQRRRIRKWADALKDEREIAGYIAETSSDDVDEELIEELFRRTRAVLKRVPTSAIRPCRSSDHHVVSQRKLNEYRRLPLRTCPPLVIDKGEVVDGHHRLSVAVERKQATLLVYDIEDAVEGEDNAPGTIQEML